MINPLNPVVENERIGFHKMEKLKDFYNRYKHGIPLLLYGIIYLTWFSWLEGANRKDYQIIHVDLDDYIPFLEIFVVPYFLWFAYVSIVVLFLFLKNKQEFNRACVFLFTGMTIFLIISTLWPNGHHLRNTVTLGDNIFAQMVSFLWKADTPTNLWPSIHVYNSLGAHFAVIRSAELENKRGIKAASGVLAVSIILSTMFIKQHSVFDVLTGIALGTLMYALVYRRDVVTAARTQGRMKRRISI